MAQTMGLVVATNDDGRAMVLALKGEGTAGCGAACQCQGRRPTRAEMPAINQVGAVVGDRVMLTIASGTLLARMAVLYLVPVAGMLVGAFTGASIASGADGSGGGPGAIFGVAGFLLGFALSITVSRIWSAVRPVMPVITRVLPARLDITPSRPFSGCGCAGR